MLGLSALSTAPIRHAQTQCLVLSLSPRTVLALNPIHRLSQNYFLQHLRPSRSSIPPPKFFAPIILLPSTPRFTSAAMPKRKRGTEPSLPEKLAQHENEIYKALKLAKGFERQRLGKRAQDKGVTEEKKVRLEKEMEVLKGLDLQATAKTHLQSSLLKVKAIAASSDLPDVLKAGDGKKEKSTGADGSEGDKEEEKARHNVTSALYNRDGVKKAVEKAVESVCEALAVPVPDKVKKVKKGDDVKAEEKKKNAKKEVEQEKMDVDGESEGAAESAFEGFESDVDEPGSVIGEEQLDEIRARVGMGAPQTCNTCWKTFATDRLAGKPTAESAPGLCKRTSKKGGCERCKEAGIKCEGPAELVLPWCDAYQELDAYLVTTWDEAKKARLEKLMRQVLSSMLLTMRLLRHPKYDAMRTANGDITSRLYGTDDDEDSDDVDDEDDEIEDPEEEAAFEDEGALSKYDSRLGHSSDEDNDDDDKDEKFFAQLRRQKAAAAAKQKQTVNLDDISGSDPGNDTDMGSLSDTSSRSASPLPQSKRAKTVNSSKPDPPKAKVKKSKKGETFLPSLMGGYISGSESASDIDIAPPKKRLGQRQRQAIAEKKYGDKAKHVEKQKQQVKWDAKRGAVGADDRPPWKRGAGRDDRRGRGGGEEEVVRREVKPTKRDDGGVLHPSWEARKKAKEGLKAVAFEGAKITFD